MKGDFTRVTFDASKHYSSVRMQQGRVHLDADWNEQRDIDLYHQRRALADALGPAAVPAASNGFGLGFDAGGALTIAAGRMYVAGVLVENDATTTYAAQPFLTPDGAQPTSGTYVAYLDVWERHIVGIDDPDIVETALGGPDHTSRTQVVWQVRLVSSATATCAAPGNAYNNAIQSSAGTLTATITPTTAATDPCVVPAAGGYRGIENQLYRVEVHVGTNKAGPPTWKWSRENGSVVSKVTSIAGSGPYTVVVDTLGRDERLSITVGSTIELVGDIQELTGEAGPIATVDAVDGTTLTVSSTDTLSLAALGTNPKARRWETAPASLVNGSPQLLENGVYVEFGAGLLRTGDYWLIPARTLTGSIEWPTSGTATAMTPHGPAHRYAKLGIVTFGPGAAVADCREFFLPATAPRHMWIVTAQLMTAGGPVTIEPRPGGSVQETQVTANAWGGTASLQVFVRSALPDLRFYDGSLIVLDEGFLGTMHDIRVARAPVTIGQASGIGAVYEYPLEWTPNNDIRTALSGAPGGARRLRVRILATRPGITLEPIVLQTEFTFRIGG
jgi:hypothetical protein